MSKYLGTVRISDEFVNILKNFNEINSSIILRANTRVFTTISSNKTILAKFVANKNMLSDELPTDVPIYMLNKFINVLGMFNSNDRVIELYDNHMTIANEEMKAEYFYSDPSVIISTKTSDIQMTPVVNYELTELDRKRIEKAAALYNLTDIAFESENGQCSIAVFDSKGYTSEKFYLLDKETNVGITRDRNYRCILKLENMKLIDGDYNIEFSENGIARFTSNKYPVTYYIAMDRDNSKFN